MRRRLHGTLEKVTPNLPDGGERSRAVPFTLTDLPNLTWCKEGLFIDWNESLKRIRWWNLQALLPLVVDAHRGSIRAGRVGGRDATLGQLEKCEIFAILVPHTCILYGKMARERSSSHHIRPRLYISIHPARPAAQQHSMPGCWYHFSGASSIFVLYRHVSLTLGLYHQYINLCPAAKCLI